MPFSGRPLPDMPYSALYLVRQWIHIYVSFWRLGGFHALREGGPRILILRPIPSCPGGSWTNFSFSPGEGGHASEVDSGYTFMRQSTVAFGRISHIFPMKVDSDPVGEHPDDWRRRVFAAFCGIFRTPYRMDVSAHFSALDDEESFFIEGSGWRGRWESVSQVSCNTNSVHASAFHGETRSSYTTVRTTTTTTTTHTHTHTTSSPPSPSSPRLGSRGDNISVSHQDSVSFRDPSGHHG